MKNHQILLASILSSQSLLAMASLDHQTELHITEIKPEDAKGAVNKLLENGVFQFSNTQSAAAEEGDAQRALKRSKSHGQQQHAQQQVRTGRNHHSNGPQVGKKTAGKKKTVREHHYETTSSDSHDDHMMYDDYYYVEEPMYDDYYYGKGSKSGKSGKSGKKHGKGKGKGGKKGKKGKKGKGKGGKGYSDDDLIVADDDMTMERTLVFEAFMDIRDAGNVIFVDYNTENEFQTGTEYIAADAPLFNLGGEFDASALLGITQALCTRTNGDEADPLSGRGYCQTTFELLDVDTVIASFVAEGPVFSDPSDQQSILTVTGGAGELYGVTGQVEMTKVLVDGTSGLIEATGNDFFDVDGYYIEATLNVLFDPDVDLPETGDGTGDDDWTELIEGTPAPTVFFTFPPSTSSFPTIAASNVPTMAPSTSNSPTVA